MFLAIGFIWFIVFCFYVCLVFLILEFGFHTPCIFRLVLDLSFGVGCFLGCYCYCFASVLFCFSFFGAFVFETLCILGISLIFSAVGVFLGLFCSVLLTFVFCFSIFGIFAFDTPIKTWQVCQF